MNEIWKDIKGFEKKYQVSNLGRVKSLIENNGHSVIYREKILKPVINKYGYCQVVLTKNNKRYTKTIHRLVAETFLKNKNKLTQVNHIDKNKQNNIITNLEWCTPSYNTIYSCGKKINQYDLLNNFVKSWNSLTEVNDKLKISKTSISNCLNNRSKTAGGYIWRYANEIN